jgi:hypothetical protein
MPVNKLENFTIEIVNRSDIHGADYNPRKITESARKKLRQGLKKYGLVQPIIVNKQTMNIVGGHQRINEMDTIIRKPDYQLSVAMINVSEKDEVGLNGFLNNQSAMGEWDITALQDIKELYPDMDYEADMGFDQSDIDVMLLENAQDDFDLVSNTVSEAKKEAKNTETDYREAKKRQRETIKEAKAAGEADVTSVDYVIQIVFPNNHEKHEFMKKIRKPEKDTYLKSSIYLTFTTMFTTYPFLEEKNEYYRNFTENRRSKDL